MLDSWERQALRGGLEWLLLLSCSLSQAS